MNEQLIFLLITEAKWGNYIIQPARVIDQGDFYNYLGQFTDEQELSPEEKSILKQCRKYEISSLYKSYGKKKYKTERDFINGNESEILKLIKSFIDKTVANIIHEIAEAGLPLYLRESRLDNPHKKDRITIETEPLKVSLGFSRNEEQIRYTLNLQDQKEKFAPFEKNIKIITTQPGIILIENHLYKLPDGFSSIRLKPFLQKKEIIIPQQNEQEYFRKFILKNIGNEEIEAEGFDIIERETQKTAILLLEKDITQQPIFELRFRYNNRNIPSYSKIPVIVELEEDGEQYRFYKTTRDYNWERLCINFLSETGLQPMPSGHFRINEKEDWYAVVEWIKQHTKLLKGKGIEVNQDKLSTKYYTGNWQLEYSQESNADWFQLHAIIKLDNGRTIPLQALWQHILTGKREYSLPDNTIFIIPEEWFARYSAIMLFGDKQKDQVVLQRNQFTLLDDVKKTETLSSSDNYVDVNVPSKLNATLREYQLTGYRWLYNLYLQRMGACLADDMGLGKTIQTISLLLKYKEETVQPEPVSLPPKKIESEQPIQLNLFDAPIIATKEFSSSQTFHTCLIVAPASVVHNWRNELQKFAPSLTVTEYLGYARANKKQALMCWDIVITTYQTLRNDINFLQKQQFGIVVFDESQSFKNRDSQVYQAVTQIKSEHFIALSGTPIENSLSDLWSLMSVINKGLLGNHTTFYNYFIKPIIADVNGIHSESLRRLIAPFILRRTKEEVLKDLPERTDELIICDPDPEQQKLYEEELSKARNRILENKLLANSNNDNFGSLQAIIRLRQIANHPRMAEPEYEHSSGKFREIFRMLEEIAGTHHKVLLFSDYVKYLDIVAEEMNARQWEYAMLTGSTKNREEVIKSFSEHSECQFFLISLKAGGVGLNLTEADYVFILDPWWNLAAEEQAISRAHRMGQKHAVFVYRFITAGTLEEKILHIQQQKQDLSDAIIVTDENTTHLSAKEMEKLIMEE